ncbi:MAG TPA: RES domain-containing protein [Longimicrobiaceae bacterium]|nr:RES domain-containing protein [Longimicrobiaceae bacterium]
MGHVPAPGDDRFLDVVDEDRLAELNLRPRVQAVLSAHPEVFGENARLDFGTIQGSGAAARKLTQAVSRELHDDPEALGIRYISRHTENEECWAVFEDRVALLFDPQVPFLDASDEDHRAAVQSAASLLKLTLPPIWS